MVTLIVQIYSKLRGADFAPRKKKTMEEICMSVPNQKIVQIGKRTVRDGKHLYAMMNLDAMQQAMRTLKGSSLKMWLYLNKNQENYTFDLSRTACLEWGIKKDSYYDGVRELVEKGYLVQAREGSNYYTFYESPRTENQNSDKQNNYFTDDQNEWTDYQKWMKQNQKSMSGNPNRNNIYNTDIVQNSTTYGIPEMRSNGKRDLGF